MAAWLRHNGKSGQNGPQGMRYEEESSPSGANTGYVDSPRVSHVASDMSGSRYRPPRGKRWDAEDVRPGPNEDYAIKRMQWETGIAAIAYRPAPSPTTTNGAHSAG